MFWEGVYKFQQKILIFKVPVIFENENFTARTAEIVDFLELSSSRNV